MRADKHGDIFTYLCLSLYGSELVEIGICFHSLHAESRGG
jgi:hypothetical protein